MHKISLVGSKLMFSSSLEALSVEMSKTEALPSIMYHLVGRQCHVRRMINGVIEGTNVSKEEGHLTRSLMPSFTFSSGAQSQMALPGSHAFIYHIFSSPVQETACHSFNEIRFVLGDLLPFLTILLPLIIEKSTCLRLQGVKMRGRVQKED